VKTATTKGVQITVKTWFREDLSDISDGRYFFNYRIFMLNRNDFQVQLLYREWFIFDSFANPKRISGEGVIGEQPQLKKDQEFDYVSGCEISSDIGSMKGYYTFRNFQSGELFRVVIPAFSLVFPPRLN
jgi:ApaG protein